MSIKRKKKRQPSARELFERCILELAALNRRYEGLFKYVHARGTLPQRKIEDNVVSFALERDMKAGECIQVRVPMKFEI